MTKQQQQKKKKKEGNRLCGEMKKRDGRERRQREEARMIDDGRFTS